MLEQAFIGLAYHTLGEHQKAEAVLEAIRANLRVGTRSVTLTGTVGSWIYYGGELQAKAAILLLYGRVEPRSQIAQALADDLLASTRKGYWQNTSNTGWILQAFASYIDTDQERQTDFTAQIQLGETSFPLMEFSGVSKQPQTLFIAPQDLIRIDETEGRDRDQEWLPLVFSKQGRGRLYYTATLRYALDAALVDPRDEGIGLFTEVLDLEGNPVSGPLQLGDVYRMHCVIYSSRDRDFLALRLPLPSGAETIDGSLATSQIVRGQEEYEDPWNFRPVQRIYDDEVRFYYDTFHRGKREVSFLFRATTPGTFPTPPATAELMYEEEVFGRTGGREFRILP